MPGMTRPTIKLTKRPSPAATPKAPTPRSRIPGQRDRSMPAPKPAFTPRRPEAAPPPKPRPPAVENPDGPRLSKVMGERGLCSRREADEWIENGWVKVDGKVVSMLGVRVS